MRIKPRYEVCRVVDSGYDKVAETDNRTLGDKWIRQNGKDGMLYVVIAVGPIRTVQIETVEKRSFTKGEPE